MSGVVHRMGVLKELAQALVDSSDEQQKVTLAVGAAMSLVERCRHAGFTVNDRGGLSTQDSSDEVVRRANELQEALGEGPCLDVARDHDTLVAPDLSVERRWPLWAPWAHDELKVGSMISVLVYCGSDSFGALSMYSHRGERFDADDVAIAQTLAAQVATFLTAGREIHQLGNALHSRTTIGQATGLVMGRLQVDSGQAFDYLRRVSSHSNRKLLDVADAIVRTGRLPDID